MSTKSYDYPPVTEDEFKEAIHCLLELVESDTDSSRVAAQVLLSAYDGQGWQVDLVSIGSLESNFYTAALTVIRGIVELRVAPQTLIDGGSEVFAELAKRWARLNTKNRWKPNCYTCWGQGVVAEFPDDPDNESLIECPDCCGRGW